MCFDCFIYRNHFFGLAHVDERKRWQQCQKRLIFYEFCAVAEMSVYYMFVYLWWCWWWCEMNVSLSLPPLLIVLFNSFWLFLAFSLFWVVYAILCYLPSSSFNHHSLPTRECKKELYSLFDVNTFAFPSISHFSLSRPVSHCDCHNSLCSFFVIIVKNKYVDFYYWHFVVLSCALHVYIGFNAYIWILYFACWLLAQRLSEWSRKQLTNFFIHRMLIYRTKRKIIHCQLDVPLSNMTHFRFIFAFHCQKNSK